MCITNKKVVKEMQKLNSKILAILFVQSLLIFIFSQAGSFVTANMLLTEERFSKGTLVGPVNISGMTVSEAEEHLLTEVEQWKKDTTYVLSYLDKSSKADKELLTVDLDQTISMKNNGEAENLHFQFNEELFNDYLTQLVPTELHKELNEKLLRSTILTEANSFQTGKETFQLENFLHNKPAYERVFITESTLPLSSSEVKLAERWIEELGPIILYANSSYSLMDNIKQSKLKIVDEELTGVSILASSLYKAVLNTNMIVKERSIGHTLPAYSELGFEAKVNSKEMDLELYNPNAASYELEFAIVDGALQTRIKGLPLQHQYEIFGSDEETYEPKTVVQYTPTLRPNESIVHEEGEDGASINMYKTVYSRTGEEISKTLISEDFYPPQEKVVKSGLSIPDTPQAETEQEEEQPSTDNKEEALESDSQEIEQEDDADGVAETPDENEEQLLDEQQAPQKGK